MVSDFELIEFLNNLIFELFEIPFLQGYCRDLSRNKNSRLCTFAKSAL